MRTASQTADARAVGCLAVAAAAALAAIGCQPPARTGNWECIAPANPGGGWDLTCRSIARALPAVGLTASTLRVSNMPGAGGGVAYAHTVTQRARDEGLLVAASPGTTLCLAQRQYGELDERDVRWVAALGAEYGIVAVSPKAPWSSLEKLMDTWRLDPGSIIVSGGSAVAGQDHMKMMLLAREVGMDPRRIRYVPFDGGGEAITALLGGFVQVFAGDASEVEAQAEAGRVRVLAVLAPERLKGALAEVPTAREAGYDVEWVVWRGFYVPGQITDAAYERWVGIMTRVGESPEWEKLRGSLRLQPFMRVGSDFEAFVAKQVETFRGLSKEIGLIR